MAYFVVGDVNENMFLHVKSALFDMTDYPVAVIAGPGGLILRPFSIHTALNKVMSVMALLLFVKSHERDCIASTQVPLVALVGVYYP